MIGSFVYCVQNSAQYNVLFRPICTQSGTRRIAAIEETLILGERRLIGADGYSPYRPIAVIAALGRYVRNRLGAVC
jgi:hypothetical protein